MCRNQVFWFLQITQDLNKIKKNPEYPFADIGKYETFTKLQQKILNSMIVGARQSFQLQKFWTYSLNSTLKHPNFESKYESKFYCLK